jgi:glycosyltransferase involved in cell wall biosynthesis
LVLIAGRHNPENNLVSVANEFLESTCPLPLVVLGTANYDSPVTQELERLAAMDPRLRLLGHVGDRSVYFDLLASASIYVHGHSVGGTNPGLIEAMACGARVVALDNAFNRETLGGVGRFFTLDGSSFAGLVTDCVNETTASERSYRDLLQVVAGDRYSLDAIVAAYAEVASAARRSGRRGGVRIRTRWENAPAAAPVLIDLRRSDAAMDEATQPVTKG